MNFACYRRLCEVSFGVVLSAFLFFGGFVAARCRVVTSVTNTAP